MAVQHGASGEPLIMRAERDPVLGPHQDRVSPDVLLRSDCLSFFVEDAHDFEGIHVDMERMSIAAGSGAGQGLVAKHPFISGIQLDPLIDGPWQRSVRLKLRAVDARPYRLGA